MAVVNTLSNNITNLDSSPPVQPRVGLQGGRLRRILDTLEVAAADDDTSTYRLARVHSSWQLPEIIIFNDAITAGTSYDIGLYQTAANGGAVVLVGAYATAIDLSSANKTGTNQAFEARDIANIQKRVWEDAGLTTDPIRFYDLVATANTVGTAAGTISVAVGYVND